MSLENFSLYDIFFWVIIIFFFLNFRGFFCRQCVTVCTVLHTYYSPLTHENLGIYDLKVTLYDFTSAMVYS